MRERFTLGAQGPYRDCGARYSPTALPVSQARSVGAGRRCGAHGPRLRARHRTRRRQLSVGARRPGAHLQARQNTPLKRGMILSNEPGYYKAGEYGIRIENLVLVIDGEKIAGAEKPLNAFETLTLAPIDRRLIELKLLGRRRGGVAPTPITPRSRGRCRHWSTTRRGVGSRPRPARSARPKAVIVLFGSNHPFVPADAGNPVFAAKPGSPLSRGRTELMIRFNINRSLSKAPRGRPRSQTTARSSARSRNPRKPWACCSC